MVNFTQFQLFVELAIACATVAAEGELWSRMMRYVATNPSIAKNVDLLMVKKSKAVTPPSSCISAATKQSYCSKEKTYFNKLHYNLIFCNELKRIQTLSFNKICFTKITYFF